MSQNYQTQDLWSRATSINGYPFDELRSVLQKSIRRGLVEEAVLAAYEFYSSGAEAEEVLWRRMEIIATEDVGFGLIEAPAILEALNAQRLRMVDRGDRWMYTVHAVPGGHAHPSRRSDGAGCEALVDTGSEAAEQAP